MALKFEEKLSKVLEIIKHLEGLSYSDAVEVIDCARGLLGKACLLQYETAQSLYHQALQLYERKHTACSSENIAYTYSSNTPSAQRQTEKGNSQTSNPTTWR